MVWSERPGRTLEWQCQHGEPTGGGMNTASLQFCGRGSNCGGLLWVIRIKKYKAKQRRERKGRKEVKSSAIEEPFHWAKNRNNYPIKMPYYPTTLPLSFPLPPHVLSMHVHAPAPKLPRSYDTMIITPALFLPPQGIFPGYRDGAPGPFSIVENWNGKSCAGNQQDGVCTRSHVMVYCSDTLLPCFFNYPRLAFVVSKWVEN